MEKNLLPRLSNCPPDIESLRLYLTLPESPLFCDRNNYVTIVIPFAKSITALKEAALKVLGKMSSLITQICHLKWFLYLFIYHALDLLLHQEIGGPNLSRRSSSGWSSCTRRLWCICCRCTRWEFPRLNKEFSTVSWKQPCASWRSCTG